MLETTENKFLIQINLRHELETIDDDNEIKMTFSKDIIKDKSVILKFPNTTTRKRSLNSDKYHKFSNLDKEIELCLQHTKIDPNYINDTKSEKALKLRIDYCGKQHNIWGVRNEHTYYLCWLSCLVFCNSTGYIHEPLTNVPLLVEMNGSGKFINMLPIYDDTIRLKNELLPIAKISFVAVPLGASLFNCEQVPKERNGNCQIVTQNKMDTEYLVKCTSTVDVMKNIKLPMEERKDIFDRSAACLIQKEDDDEEVSICMENDHEDIKLI